MTQRKLFVGSSASVVLFTALFFGISGTTYHPRHAEAAPEVPTTIPLAQPQVPQPPAAAGGSLQNLFVNISERMMPSVVNIFTTQNVRMQRPHQMPGDPWGELFGNPFAEEQGFSGARPLPPGGGAARPMALGTGFVIEAEGESGLILTNNHVITGADDVKVKFTESEDEHELPAQVIAKDPELDIALLKVQGAGHKLQAVALGDSDRLKVGEWIAAVGNPFGHGHSISHGIVSAKARSLPGGFGKYLQVDAPINPGNSGGPLVNMNGEVVGINNAIDARGPGIGFAIPINAVKVVLNQLKNGKTVERGYLGVNIMPLQAELANALQAGDIASGTPVVAQVMPGTPAAHAGMRPYDIISKLDGQTVKSTEELMQIVLQVPVGHKIKAEVIRGGKHMTLDVPVARRPEPQRS